jgi:tetratricopeptide (TPR) repeat protein
MRTAVIFAAASALALAAASAAPARPGTLDGAAVVKAQPSPLEYRKQAEAAARLYSEGKFREAEPIADRLVESYPFDGHNWLLAARIKRKLGEYAAAAQDYRRVIELLGPGVPGNARYWLAVSLAAIGDKTGALDALDHLVFDDHYVERPQLYDDKAFATLRSDPRFLRICGRVDTKGLSRTEGWRRDIDYLTAEVKRVDPDYHDRPLPAEYQRLSKALAADVPRLSDAEVYVGLSRMLASLDQGHTALWPFVPAEKIDYRVLPIQFYVFPEGVFVVDAQPAARDLIGSELVKIEDTPAAEALDRVRAITIHDSGMEELWLGPLDLSLAQALVGLGIAKRTDQISVTLRTPGGQLVTRTIATVPFWVKTKLHAAPEAPAPLAFRDVDRGHWLTPAPDASTLYVQVNQIADDPDETLEAFGRRLRTALKDPTIRNVILDLRHDNGGNTFDYVELLRTLVAFSQEDGRKLYVIAGRGTYSAAGNLATDLERLADPVFVGEPTGMTGNNYGDESQFRLPWSGVYGAVTSLKWQLGYPTDQRRSITPQVPVQLTAKDYFAGRDPIVETALALARERVAAKP